MGDALIIVGALMYLVVGFIYSAEHAEAAIFWPVITVADAVAWLVDRLHTDGPT